MPVLIHQDGEDLRHLQVSPDTWFYMNHIHRHKTEAAHDHNYAELAFVLGGSARHTTIRGESVCSRGDVLLIPRGAWHGYSACRRFEVVNCLLSPALLENELACVRSEYPFADWPEWTESLGGVEIRTLHLPERRLAVARQRLEALEAAYCRWGSRLELIGHLLLTLDVLKSARGPSQSPSLHVHQEHPSIRASLALLHRDYAHDWTLGKLAGHLRLNSSYLVRLFNIHVGQPPMKYLSKIRAHRAATLLLTTRLRIAEVGERVGWPEPKLFARQFRQHFSMSASDYRHKQLQPFQAR